MTCALGDFHCCNILKHVEEVIAACSMDGGLNLIFNLHFWVISGSISVILLCCFSFLSFVTNKFFIRVNCFIVQMLLSFANFAILSKET